MYNSGDAAEQIVRISLEGTEVALKLTRLCGEKYCCYDLRCFEKQG